MAVRCPGGEDQGERGGYPRARDCPGGAVPYDDADVRSAPENRRPAATERPTARITTFANPCPSRSEADIDPYLAPSKSAVQTRLHRFAALEAIVLSRRFRRSCGVLLALVLASTVSANAQTAAEADNLEAEVARLCRSGRHIDAIPIAQRALAIREKSQGPEHLSVAALLHTLAWLYDIQGRWAEEESSLKRSVAIRENVLGSDHPDVAILLDSLALLYDGRRRYDEAEPLMKRSLAIREKAEGLDHPNVATVLNSLAELYRAQGRYTEAEPLFKRSLAIYDSTLGAEDPKVAAALTNLALLYRNQGRNAEAQPLEKRSLAIRKNASDLGHPSTAGSLDNLADLYSSQGRYAEALAIREKAHGPNHPLVAGMLDRLAAQYRYEGRFSEAEPLLERSVAIWEGAFGPYHIGVAGSLSEHALLYEYQGRYSEAEPLYERSLAIGEKVLGPDHPQVASSLDNLARLALKQNKLSSAAENWRHSTAILQRRTERGLGTGFNGSAKGEAQRKSRHFVGLIKTNYRLAAEDSGNAKQVAAEMFAAAQWARWSEAATSLSQMAARSAVGSHELATLVRERQDLVGEWQGKDKLLITARSELPQKRDATSEKVLADRLTEIDARLAMIDARLADGFPDFAALSSVKPVSVTDVQSSLRDDEALLLFLDTNDGFKPLPEETFVWIVTRTNLRWLRSQLGSKALRREVAALRCGLDYAGSWLARDSRCRELTGTAYTPADDKSGKPLPFSVERAHALYLSLLGAAQDLISGKHLIVVPSGALTQLPMSVLVTDKPTASNPEHTAWLARLNRVTVLPAVSSLAALRRHARASAATKPYLGYGDPLLDGPDASFNKLRGAAAAAASAECGGTPRLEVADLRGLSGVRSLELRGGIADVDALRKAVPLPETATELCDVAKSVGGEADVRLGARATETDVKRMNDARQLLDYRIVHFATHGAMAGEVSEAAEAGLLLTPPAAASEKDDGYLSASEIARLKLDADWVILSACNTAAAGAHDAEALSGLARAFFYAGARSLLVSHWYVDSEATVALIQGAFDELKSHPEIDRSEAMRRSMLALIDEDLPPASWAPFVVVGEGAGTQ